MPTDRYIILLRGINLGASNRIAMPALREALAQAGFADIQTYVQSGNIVVSHTAGPAGLTAAIEQLIHSRFGLSVPATVRTRDELAAVVQQNPFPEAAASDPKHYQVTFLSSEPDTEAFAELTKLAQLEERITMHGREVYAWHPTGIHLSKLANRLTPKNLGVESATARNWTTVTTLLEMTTDGA